MFIISCISCRLWDPDLCFAFHNTAITVYFPRSYTKSAVDVFVLTHSVWSCPISGCMHGWPVWAKCFHWCGSESNAAAAIRLSHGGMRGLLTSLGLSWPRTVARLSSLNQKPDVSKVRESSWVTVTQIGPEGDKEFNLFGTLPKMLFL